jgi:hypothetical protein
MSPSPEVVGPASRVRRRYADAPAAALLTGSPIADGQSSHFLLFQLDSPDRAGVHGSLRYERGSRSMGSEASALQLALLTRSRLLTSLDAQRGRSRAAGCPTGESPAQ